MPTISVIIPIFNRSKLVVNAIRSVLGQTYRDYEIIVVDDGSTDDTAEALRDTMDRIRYVYKAILDRAAAQNRGIQLAGQVDIDSCVRRFMASTKLEAQLKVVTMLGNGFGACFTDCDFFGSTHAIRSAFEQAGLHKDLSFGPLEEPFKFILARYPAIYVQSLLVLRSLVEYPNGFDEGIAVAEDTDLLFRLAFNTKFCFVNERLVTIDRTPSREVGLMELFSRSDDRAFGSMEHVLQKWIRLLENMEPELRQTLRKSLSSYTTTGL